MTAFRILLIILSLGIAAYTGIIIFEHGMTLFPIFLGDMLDLNWSGQFNLDFLCYLTLSAVWIAWRHRFSLAGLAIALVAGVLGMVVFGPYLLFITFQAKGNIQTILMGETAA